MWSNPVIRRARFRRRRKGPGHTHARPTLPPAEYDALRARILERFRHRCGYCGRARTLDLHHVVKRSQGGTWDEDNLIPLDRTCHDRTDWPFAKGRLRIVPLGGGRFACELIFARDKWEVRAG